MLSTNLLIDCVTLALGEPRDTLAAVVCGVATALEPWPAGAVSMTYDMGAIAPSRGQQVDNEPRLYPDS